MAADCYWKITCIYLMMEAAYWLTEIGYGLTEADYGLTEANYELTEADYELTEADYELTEADYGLTEANYGLTEANYGLTEANYELTEVRKDRCFGGNGCFGILSADILACSGEFAKRKRIWLGRVDGNFIVLCLGTGSQCKSIRFIPAPVFVVILALVE